MTGSRSFAARRSGLASGLALAVRPAVLAEVSGVKVGPEDRFCEAIRNDLRVLFSAGGLECLAASVRYAVSYIYMDRFLARRGISAIVLSACQLAAAAVMLAIALGFSGVPTPKVSTESIAALAVLGIIGTGFAYVLNYQIITSEGATVASTVTYLLPVVAIVLGVLVLNETITATTLGGIALVLAGIAITRRQPKSVSESPNLGSGFAL